MVGYTQPNEPLKKAGIPNSTNEIIVFIENWEFGANFYFEIHATSLSADFDNKFFTSKQNVVKVHISDDILSILQF